MTQLEAVGPAASVSDTPENQLDILLQPLVDAIDEVARRAALEQLLVVVAAPVMKAVLRRKIGSIGTGCRFQGQDEEDIAGAAMVRLIGRLQHDLTLHPIERFRDYVAAVASHAFNDHLRRQEPERTRLSAAILRVLRRDSRFDVWHDGQDMTGGFVAWRGRQAGHVDPERLRHLLTPEADLADSLVAVFRISDAPLAIAKLTGILAPYFAGGRSSTDTPVEDVPADERTPWLELHLSRTAQVVWREMELLPPDQRVAILLHLRDPSGRTALPFFPIAGVATLQEIATAMGLGELELADLWRELPMPDDKIAERLAVSRQRVINLRSAGRKRLARRLGREGLW